jgi:hypothetical protein
MDSPHWIATNLSAARLSGVWHERALVRRTDAYFKASMKRSQRRVVREVLKWWRKLHPPVATRIRLSARERLAPLGVRAYSFDRHSDAGGPATGCFSAK